MQCSMINLRRCWACLLYRQNRLLPLQSAKLRICQRNLAFAFSILAEMGLIKLYGNATCEDFASRGIDTLRFSQHVQSCMGYFGGTWGR